MSLAELQLVAFWCEGLCGVRNVESFVCRAVQERDGGLREGLSSWQQLSHDGTVVRAQHVSPHFSLGEERHQPRAAENVIYSRPIVGPPAARHIAQTGCNIQRGPWEAGHLIVLYFVDLIFVNSWFFKIISCVTVQIFAEI